MTHPADVPYPTSEAPYWPLFQRLLSSMPGVRRKVEQDPNQPGHPHEGVFFPTRILAPASFNSAIKIADMEPADSNVDWIICDLDDSTYGTPTNEMLRWALSPIGGFLIAKASSVERRHAILSFTDDWTSKGLWRSQLKLNELMVGLKPWETNVCTGWDDAASVWMIELRPSPFTIVKASYGFLTADRAFSQR